MCCSFVPIVPIQSLHCQRLIESKKTLVPKSSEKIVFVLSLLLFLSISAIIPSNCVCSESRSPQGYQGIRGRVTKKLVRIP